MNVSVRPVVETRFAATEQRVASVRQWLRAQLNNWQQPAIIDDVMLAATEVITNAVRHGSKGPTDSITVAIELSGNDLRVNVADSSTKLPTLRDVSPLEDGGRGLHLLGALSKSWGVDVERDGAGKTVWFTITLARQHQSSRPSAESSRPEGSHNLCHRPEQDRKPLRNCIVLGDDSGAVPPDEVGTTPRQPFNPGLVRFAGRVA